ncbi:ABC transporter substrate-binding protein [filamentous cyanobacterium LEGE 11480]|uniref:ABC transporter substrate-binding protein n=1 Tax=Romeriopsis navalis LEGE 11480 TaxID=2777977 RepID=A0A928VGF0_9CYAN|nr:ABC transporter substrate-binding protein [Romeriopsis navalis]MBE9028146.1 ABC transporter substrate-binding protein [Romeriopsis navalis LEGE 11480]
MFRLLRRKFASLLSVVALATATLFLTVACSGQGSNQSAPIAIATLPWVGYSGQYIGVAKGFFKEQGLNIQDVAFQSSSDQIAAFLSKKIDIAWITSGDAVQVAAKEPTAKIIYTADYSNGGDGIIGRDINSAADLKGKTVAREDILFTKLFLRAYLKQGGLTEKDITLKNMTADAAATAFAAKQVDAAVSFEPYLRKAAKEGGGSVIFSSEGTNLIADVLVVREDLIKSRKADLEKYLKAVDKGVKLLLADDAEALKIVGSKLGVTPDEVKEQKALVKVFDIEANKTIAFNPDNPQNIMGNLELTAKAAYDFKVSDKVIDITTFADESLIKAL